MNRKPLQKLCLALMIGLIPVSAFAMSLNEAANRASRLNNNAKVLSAKTVQVGNVRVHYIKLLTKNGVVKTVKIADNTPKRKR